MQANGGENNKLVPEVMSVILIAEQNHAQQYSDLGWNRKTKENSMSVQGKESEGTDGEAAFAYLPARRRKLSTTGILLSVFYQLFMSMAAATLMPAMAVDLGGIGGYTFGLSIYLVCTAVSIPFSGMLARKFSMRTLLLIANALELGGCILSFYAQSMGALIITFMIIVSFGLGLNYALTPIAISGLYEKRSAAYWMSVEGVIYAVSQLTAPLLAGIVIDRWNWRVMMLVAAPVVILGSIFLLFLPTERPDNKDMRFDLTGTGLMASAFLCFSVASKMGNAKGWINPIPLLLLAGAVLSAFLFLKVERRRGGDALLPLEPFKNRRLLLLFLAAGLARMSISVFRTYISVYVLEGMGRSSTQVGITMACAGALGILLNVPIGKRMIRKGKVTGVLLSGMGVVVCILCYFLFIVRVDSQIWMVWLGMFIYSYSSMLSGSAYVVAAQLVLPVELVAPALVAVQFAESGSSTLVSAVNGALLGAFPSIQSGMNACYLLDLGICVLLTGVLLKLRVTPAQETNR